MKYFIEWESGRTEIADVYENGKVVLEGGQLVQWPLAWPDAVLSAVELYRPPPVDEKYFSNLQMLAGFQGPGALQGFAQNTPLSNPMGWGGYESR